MQFKQTTHKHFNPNSFYKVHKGLITDQRTESVDSTIVPQYHSLIQNVIFID